MTNDQRANLQQNFCIRTVQDMSERDRISFTYNVLMDSYSKYSDEDFIVEVTKYFPELLETDEQKVECN